MSTPDTPTPPPGRRWLNSTKQLWRAWHEPDGLAHELTDANRLQLPTLLTLHDDLARAKSPTARVRLSNEVRQFTKRLSHKPKKEKRQWQPLDRRELESHYDPDVFPVDVRGDSDGEIAYMTEAQAHYGDKWREARGNPPPPERSPEEQTAYREMCATAVRDAYGALYE